MTEKKANNSCVIYLSESEQEFSTLELDKLAQKASFKNERLGISGFLCFARGRFLQYLEGETQAIEGLMADIKSDKRHTLIYELDARPIERPLFSSWAMRLIAHKELFKFNFELQIEQNLLYIKNDYWFKERCETYVWQHIEQMSKLKKYLDIYDARKSEPDYLIRPYLTQP